MDDIQEAQKNAIRLLKNLIEIPSYSREEKSVADHLQTYIESMGYKANRLMNNVWIKGTDFELSRPTLLLNSHLDTVRPTAGWERDPHKAKLEGDRLYGLGSNDAGASLVSLLHTFFLLSKKKQNYNLIFAASAEEEVSGKNGLELLLPELPHLDFAIVGEPTGMQMAIAEKGLMVVDCVAKGKSGHAARNEGVNAIYKAMKDIEWIQNAQLPKISPSLGPVKMTVTMVHAGTQHNVIPDECSFVIDVRSNECYSNQEVFSILDVNLDSEIKARSYRLTSSGVSVDLPIVQKGIQLGMSTYGSPTLSDQAFMHFPSLKLGPGESSRSHTADEFVELQEVRNAIPTYVSLLDGMTFEKFV
ncbi:MAG: M20 family metallo-hydrolase [Paludibacteraceae bacterium]|nr:M20 family metallo-hydrolase [Paludibacteraceae bacterium]MBR5972964.1 M20 family metallo-hydrolase [Paludibacteraceae bacterium]